MPDSLTHLAGLRVGAEEFLAAVLATAAQPIWVVDPDGVIRFANPAAIDALGYDSADELFGRYSHETIHYSRPDGSPYPAGDCPMLLPRATGETVARDLDWFFRRDGSMFPVSYVSAPIEMPGGRGAVVAFTDIEERLRAEQILREREADYAEQRASLRRVATLVAAGAASSDVFAAIAREVGHVIGLPLVAVWRFEADGTATVVGAWSDRQQPFEVGSRWPLDGPTICGRIRETGRPTQIDDFAGVPGSIADAARATGIRSCAGAPIVVDGEVWGAMSTDSTDPAPLPDRIEDRLVEFTELVATAISNSASREELARLAEEQAALRRVATLVAREPSPAEVFAAVAREVGVLLGVENVRMVRHEPDATPTVVAEWGELDGTIGADARPRGSRSAVGAPIVVDGRIWGQMIATSRDAEPLPPDTEARIGEFTELVATAISNIEARSELAASRARIVAAADDERRRVVRDLHDGAQQRLVQTVVTLKLARQQFQNEVGSGPTLVDDALDQAQRATAELRELARGILPSVLTRDGLRAGVEALAARMSVPVQIDLTDGRMPAAVEATAYFVVAEALTNVAKHAQAEGAAVIARVEDGALRVEVRDDGIGGARPDGSGLLGLGDRVAVLDGRLRVESPAGGGTLVAADIPLPC